MADAGGTVDIYLRAFAEPTAGKTAKRSRKGKPTPGWVPAPGEREVLLLHTVADAAQRLAFGVWRLCRESLHPDGTFARLEVREEGLILSLIHI